MIIILSLVISFFTIWCFVFNTGYVRWLLKSGNIKGAVATLLLALTALALPLYLAWFRIVLLLK